MSEIFKFLLFILFLSSAWSSSLILQENFTTADYVSYFNRQCSYTDPTCNNHYAILTFQNQTSLRITILPGDQPFQNGSPTDPRTELRMIQDAIKAGVQYTITWNLNVQNYTEGYYFCFFQLFNANASHPEIMLRWENEQYSLWFNASNQHIILKGSMQEDVGQTSTWRVTATLKSNNGYLKVERKRSSENSFSLLGEYTGQTQSGTDDHYLKIGIYTQHTDVQRLDMYVNDLEIVQN